ncbi:Methyltransferase domain-containing protein [Thermosyntropha lipolytica DSM 11003]|uniref:Methyltransferase domain-containing protein n=1 Tax=Thermosyntropha lipolytica DSM 11003 TaxID=1123382 RepID=A0A1M5NEK0_9FIRM|nr:methyltransferase domain-containing protein [Thermosyntropha lipolytica]SHG88004.1 Methyltransferase domain-containing protein [Thermosyntropha lipolytica DSM 11003]
MGHKFDEKNMHKLDNPKRRELLPPDEILKGIGLGPGMIMADIGCGIGYFTLPAARLAGKEGKIIALDLSEEMLAVLKEKLALENIDNVDVIKNEENKLPLEDNSVDIGFLCHVMHEAENRSVFLKEVKRIIKPGGKIVIIEWEKKETESGPPLEHRISREEMQKLLKEAGFRDISLTSINGVFYLIQGKYDS